MQERANNNKLQKQDTETFYSYFIWHKMHAGINILHFDNILRDSPPAALEQASWRFRMHKGEPAP